MPSSVSLIGMAVMLAAHGSAPSERVPLAALQQVQDFPPERVASGDDAIARGSSRDAASRYDEVGLASWYGEELGPAARAANGDHFDPAAITIAHRTLPLGSFVEITAIDTGRTIVARVTDRGPHRRDRLIDLSRGAAKLLGTYGKSMAAVRVRDVALSPDDAAALRAGHPASPRLDETPQLLAALRKRLNAPTTPTAMPVSTAAPVPKPGPIFSDAVVSDSTKPSPHKSSTKPMHDPAPAFTANGHYVVQLGTFSDRDHARLLAARLSGRVEPAGKLWRVRLGPFATSTEAKRARDGAAKRGYGDAVVVRQD